MIMPKVQNVKAAQCEQNTSIKAVICMAKHQKNPKNQSNIVDDLQTFNLTVLFGDPFMVIARQAPKIPIHRFNEMIFYSFDAQKQ